MSVNSERHFRAVLGLSLILGLGTFLASNPASLLSGGDLIMTDSESTEPSVAPTVTRTPESMAAANNTWSSPTNPMTVAPGDLAGLPGEAQVLRQLDDYTHLHARIRQQIESGATESPNVVLYICSAGCGGLGDRISGMLNAFYLALLTDRAFFIQWPDLVPLEDVWEPNAIDWRKPSQLEDVLGRYQFVCTDKCKNNWNETDFSLWNPFVTVRSNMLIAGNLFSNPHLQENINKYRLRNDEGFLIRTLYLYLFRLRPKLQSVVDELLSKSTGGAKIGVHIRTGGWGTLNDPDRMKRSDIQLFKDAMNATAAKLHDSCPSFFLVTDTSELLTTLPEWARDSQLAAPIHILPDADHPITHLHKTLANESVIAGIERTFIEFHLLTRMDMLIGTRSGFSEMASAISCAPSLIFGSRLGLFNSKMDETRFFSRGLCFPLLSSGESNLSTAPTSWYNKAGAQILTFQHLTLSVPCGQTGFN